jgi:purine-binding chemotaxis protein CheW
MIAPKPDARTAPAGKYLFFRMGREEYGLEILRIHEIADAGGIRPWPGQPSCGAGTLELRGRRVPVVDLRDRLQGGDGREGDDPVVVVVEMRLDDERLLVGLRVDAVGDVRRLAPEQIMERPPSIDGPGEPDLIAGLGRTDGGVACLLAPDRLLTEDELRTLTEPLAYA